MKTKVEFAHTFMSNDEINAILAMEEIFEVDMDIDGNFLVDDADDQDSILVVCE